MQRPPRQRVDGGMVWPFLVSFAAHAVVLGLLFATPNRFLAVAAPIGESYTVDLLAPDVLGGDSGPLGPGSEPDQAPAPPQPEVVAALPVPEVEEVAVEAEPEPEVPAEAVPENAAETVDAGAAEEADFVEPTVAPPPEPTPTASLPAATATRAVPPTAVVAAATATRAVPPTAVVAAATATRAVPTAAVARATAPPTRQVARATPAPARPTADANAERDKRIAEAVKTRAAAAARSAADERIAAAVERRAQQLRGGGGTGIDGPLSTGPGTGAGGGTVIDAEYILFKRRMEARIREAWVWAGAQDHLESVVRFAVSPEGEVSEIRTVRSSGDGAYDASAERAVRSASPLGMVPQAYRQEFADVEMTFRARDLQR